MRRTLLALRLLAALALLSGCQPTGLEAPGQHELHREPASAADHDSGAALPAQSPPAWDVIYMRQQPVGYQSLTLAPQLQGEETVFDATASSALRVQRFGQPTQETLQMASRETRDGEVVWVESRTQSGGGQMHTVGRRRGNELHWESHAGDQLQQWSLPLPPKCGGYFAVEWSLRRQPLKPGEQRELSAIVPVLNQVASVTLTAGNYEPVALLNETVDLLPIHQHLVLPSGGSIDSISWMNATGDVQKSEIATLQQVSYRVDRATALEAIQQATFDLGQFSTVRLAQPLVNPQRTRQVRYQIRMHEGNPAEYFLDGPSQSVTVVDAHTLALTVRAIRPDDAVGQFAIGILAGARRDTAVGDDPERRSGRAGARAPDSTRGRRRLVRCRRDGAICLRIAHAEGLFDGLCHRGGRGSQPAGRLYGTCGADGRIVSRPKCAMSRPDRPRLCRLSAGIRLSYVE